MANQAMDLLCRSLGNVQITDGYTVQILLVEPDVQFLSLMKLVLSGEGYDIQTCQTGSEAMMKSMMIDFDLLICEVQVPDFQGADLIRTIKAQNPHLPVFVLTELDPTAWEDVCLSAGADQFFSKPPDLEQIKEEVMMVRMGRAGLDVCIVDPDTIHRNRLRVSLVAQGCQVRAWEDMAEALPDLSSKPPTLLVMDAQQENAIELLGWAKARNITVFVFSGELSDELEDAMMRTGAALIMNKPVDCDALMTQARFLAAGF
ncbi:MAG: response regulator [Myxococcales bacterium]|nr:response regulator [Myxococcales bacterium]